MKRELIASVRQMIRWALDERKRALEKGFSETTRTAALSAFRAYRLSAWCAASPLRK